MYQAVFIAPVVSLSGMIYRFDKMIIDGIVNLGGKIGIALSVTADWLDRYIVDGLVNLTGSISKAIGNFTRHFQTGPEAGDVRHGFPAEHTSGVA